MKKLQLCEALYDVPILFPPSPQKGVVFYSLLLSATLAIVTYFLGRLYRQQLLMATGQIRAMKEWLLPVYTKFLKMCVIVYLVKALDIALVFLLFRADIQHDMPLYAALMHAASFWTSEFWLFDSLFFFLLGNSHGTIAIRHSLWAGSALWVVNSVVVSIAIRERHSHGYFFYVAVYAVQWLIVAAGVVFMAVKRLPHHRNIIPLVLCQWTVLTLRLVGDTMRGMQFDAFCVMDAADILGSTVLPVLVIVTLRWDSAHWGELSNMMQTRNRGSIYGALNEALGGKDAARRQSMTVWAEFLSQHTKILKPNMLSVSTYDRQYARANSKQLVGGSGRVERARYKGKAVAVKEWKFQHFTKHVVAMWCKEALISSNFRHRNVVDLVGICIEPPSIKIVMKWCKYGTLRGYLVGAYKAKRHLPWDVRFKFLLDIAAGMNHLHRNGLVHRDLKTLNLLLDEEVVVFDHEADMYDGSGSGSLGEKGKGTAGGNGNRSLFGISSGSGQLTGMDAHVGRTHNHNAHKSVRDRDREWRGGGNGSGKLKFDRRHERRGGERQEPSGLVVRICDFGSSRAVDMAKYTKGRGLHVGDAERALLTYEPTDGTDGGSALKRFTDKLLTGKKKKGLGLMSNSNGTKGLALVPEVLAVSGSGVDLPQVRIEVEEVCCNTQEEEEEESEEKEMKGGEYLAALASGDGVLVGNGSGSVLSGVLDAGTQLSLTSHLLRDLTASMSTIVGSVQFLPPEILRNIKFREKSRTAKSVRKSLYGFSADVYSFACVMWEVVTCREIYKGRSYISIQDAVLAGKRESVLPNDMDGCPDAQFMLELMTRCWAQDAAMRPNFTQICDLLRERRATFFQ